MSLEVLEGDSSGGDENIARGNRLHSELVREVKTLGFDSFAHKYRTNLDRSSDVMISFALKQADEDAIRRQFLKGPSIKRDKFTSKYWKVWNEEKNLLEDLTYNKVVAAAENVPSSRQSSKPKRTIKKPSTASSIAGNGWRASTVHGGKFAYPKVDSHFDFHVLGNIDVKYLLKNSLGRDYPRHHSELSDDPIPQVHEHIKGGAVSTQSRHHPSERNETSRCDFMDQTPSIQPNKGCSFTSSKRFPSVQQHSSKLTATRARTTASVKRNHDYKPVVSLLPGSSFSKSDRFTEKSRNSVKILYESPILESLGGVETGSPEEGATSSLGEGATGMETKEFEYFPNDSPGPGQYTIDRIFEGRKQTYNATTTTASDFNAIVGKYRSESELKSRQLHGMNVHGLTRLGVMGLHCSRQEHVLYGACLDGKCFNRSQEEKSFLYRNDLRRLGGYTAVERYGRNKEKLQGEMQLNTLMQGLIDEPLYAVEPLYAAAYKGDVDAIKALAKLKVDPNAQHPDSGYTALHVAVFKYKLDSVVALLSEFKDTLILDVADWKGETALHIASRLDIGDIVAVICDSPTCDPLSKANKMGRYPIDVARSHQTYQFIKVCQERNRLAKELRALKRIIM